MQQCEYAILHVYKYPCGQVCKFAIMQVCVYARSVRFNCVIKKLCIYACMQRYMNASIFIFQIKKIRYFQIFQILKSICKTCFTLLLSSKSCHFFSQKLHLLSLTVFLSLKFSHPELASHHPGTSIAPSGDLHCTIRGPASHFLGPCIRTSGNLHQIIQTCIT